MEKLSEKTLRKVVKAKDVEVCGCMSKAEIIKAFFFQWYNKT